MDSFKDRLVATLKDLLASKKVMMTIAALTTGALAKYGIGLSSDTVLAVLGLFGSLILAQGASDLGKGAAIVKAVSPPQPEQTQTVNIETDRPIEVRR